MGELYLSSAAADVIVRLRRVERFQPKVATLQPNRVPIHNAGVAHATAHRKSGRDLCGRNLLNGLPGSALPLLTRRYKSDASDGKQPYR